MTHAAEIWDAIVIGAGPTGVLATERLRRAGQRVLLLEAGGRDGKRQQRTSEDDPRWRFVAQGARATWWRAHGVGGNTRLWGGWANRFPRDVLRAGGFPFDADELAPDYRSAERWLGVVEGRLDPRYRRASRALGLSILPRRNARVGTRTWTARHPAAARTARTHTIALRLNFTRSGTRPVTSASDVTAVEVLGSRGLEWLRARAYVLALSPLETFRLLAASGFAHAELGRSLRDHVVAHALLIEPRSEIATGERGPFPGSAFAPGAAANACVELIGPFPLSRNDRSWLNAVGVHPPHGARITRIAAMGTLAPHPGRFVDLSPCVRDALGRPVPRVHFAWSAEDDALPGKLGELCARFADALATQGAQLIELPQALGVAQLFHPSGTCRMGHDATAPCDAWGRLRATRNVWITDASVFPSPGDRHPTLTLLAHTLRVVASMTHALDHTLVDS